MSDRRHPRRNVKGRSVKGRSLKGRSFQDLSPRQKAVGALSVVLQVSLAVAAWIDLAMRPAEQVRGRKPLWAAVIAINYVGPVVYYWRGISHHAKTIP